MKKLFNLIRTIWRWFMGLFKTKPTVQKESKPDNTIGWTNPTVPAHNNRKNTRGRFTQYISMGNGIFRPIYHGAKN